MTWKLLDRWYRSVFGHAMLGAALLWAALPPCDLWPLAWIAPVWWILLIRREDLPGHPYRAIYLAGFLFWLAAFYWLTLPYWANVFLWILNAFYMGCYLPMFVGLSRVAVRRFRLPVAVAAPVVWTGLELARGYVLTGTTMASLGHTQYRWIELIQIADLVGAYGLNFVVMLVAACLGRMVPLGGRRWALWPLVPASVVLAAVLCYGHLRMSRPDNATPAVRVALIQGSIDAEFKTESNTSSEAREQIHDHYLDLSRNATAEYADLDLMVWPETMFRTTLITYDRDARLIDYCRKEEIDKYRKANWTDAEIEAWLRKSNPETPVEMREIAEQLRTSLILGVDRLHYTAEGEEYFNSAAFITKENGAWRRAGCYDKIHLVLFGEYIPGAEYFPWVYELTPLSSGATPGEEPVAFELKGLRFAPNICYESVLPRVIRRQVNDLRRRGQQPDVLVNLTNDGWFWGSSELDMHLICGVFRAVECRKPFLIAANTGISAWIDGNGQILARGPRRATDTLLAAVRRDGRTSPYLQYGDWPAGVCLAACILLAVVGFRRRKR